MELKVPVLLLFFVPDTWLGMKNVTVNKKTESQPHQKLQV